MLVSALVNCSVLITSSGVAIAADWSTNDTPSVQAPTRRMVRFNSSAPVTQTSSPTYSARPGGYGAYFMERRRQRQQGVGNFGGGPVPAPGPGPGGITSADSRYPGTDSKQEDMSQMEQVRLQQMMEQRSQAEQAASNTQKKHSETMDSIINNIK